MDEVAKNVVAFLVKETGGVRPEDIKSDMSLTENGLLDSIGKMKLIVFLEQSYHVAIEAKDVEAGHLDTVSAISKFVLSKGKAK